MTTKRYTVTGKALWAKVFEENRDMKGYQDAAVPYDGFYKIGVILDKEQRSVFKDSGSALRATYDDDGNFIVTFKRKHKDRFEWASGAPSVVDASGSKWTFKDNGIIPNNSIVLVEFTVYSTSMSNGTRLEKVTVLGKADYEEKEKEPLPLSDAPGVIAPAPRSFPEFRNAAKHLPADDEIPF